MAGYSAGAHGRTARVRRGCLLATVVALTVAGCAAEPDFEWPDDPVAAPPATVDTVEAAAHDELLTTFDAFRQVEIAAQADPEPAYLAQERLGDYLADPLLALTLFELETMHRRGLVRQGEPRWQPTVTALRLDEAPPTAVIRDCLDTTDWQLASRASGAPAAPNGLPGRFAPDRYVIEYDARLVDGRWLFDDARVERGEQC